ncbi:aspartyl/glutamyl-tRNA amidotransferase subunit A [Peribacillus cavernae]|uniref:Aspartyl/glutamyl-tRNA amidotransferase subunit A n=1 Tax=Peribacillus cavernae TaxID=1674310 RepID=A0A433HWX7_9BACI|nr:amidase [Peribacillus cavernae]MDQ0221116.1 aspartyl-tRNA(Asn)/glutamyl-tRNA(Gln) amidotransferase subunit A [Peribacillus cavernae]RUQ32843.1 aspartyl/glutamyl-tRNA amidotransferase subunit A [Peribacillus cavernae]
MESIRSNNILEWSLSDVSQAIREKQISPVEVTKATIRQIHKTNPELNAFITVMEERALKKAQEAEQEIQNGNYKGALHGIPIGLKDIIYTKDILTTFGAEKYKDFLPDYDAEIVTRLENAGSIIVGKLNLHQFAIGTTGDRSYFGPTKHPNHPTKITGGSSAGSATAVAANLCYGSIGSDTGGSIRMPASICGIVGMKPTFGRVSKHGALVVSWTLDHLGPMTRTVKDNAIMLNYVSGYDPKDAYSVKRNDEDFTRNIGTGIKDMTIGIPTSFYFDIIEPEVLRIFNNNVDKLKEQGAKIVEVHLPYMNELLMAQQVILSSESYVALENELKENPELIDEEVRSRITSGMLTLASDYIQMMRVKHLAIDMFSEVFKEVDAIITPTMCALPTDIDQREFDLLGKKEHTRIFARLTGPTNTVGLPSISVPGGYSDDGLPVGIQFIGAPFDEKTLYQIAYVIEQNT